MLCQALLIISKPSVNSNRGYSPETPNSGQNQWFFFVLFELEIWRMTLKNNKAPLLCYFKLCVPFRSHQSIQTGVTVRKHPIRVKIDNFLSRATLIFDRWPLKTIGYIFYATASVVASFRSHVWIQTGVTIRKHGNIFHVTGSLWGESTSHWWIPLTTGQECGALKFSLMLA